MSTESEKILAHELTPCEVVAHHSHIVAIKGDSYRKHEASQERHGRPDDQDE